MGGTGGRSRASLPPAAGRARAGARPCPRPRHLDLDLSLLAVDAAGGRAQAERHLFGQAGACSHPHAQRRGHLVAHQPGCHLAPGDPRRDLVAGQDQLDPVRLTVQRAAHQLASPCAQNGILWTLERRVKKPGVFPRKPPAGGLTMGCQDGSRTYVLFALAHSTRSAEGCQVAVCVDQRAQKDPESFPQRSRASRRVPLLWHWMATEGCTQARPSKQKRGGLSKSSVRA